MTTYNSVAVHDLSHVEVSVKTRPGSAGWVDLSFVSKDGDVLVLGIFYDNVAENQIRLAKLADFMRDNFAKPRTT